VILVDTNVLLDVFEDDAEWSDWSQDRLETASVTDTLAINPVIYSELSIGFARIEELEAVIKEASLSIEDIPREALFLAGKAFLRYRRSRGGAKRSVLPDFYIGAHAAVMEWPVLTREVGRYRTYFPTVSLIAP
jgi:predicted nucleic acid-binding protein